MKKILYFFISIQLIACSGNKNTSEQAYNPDLATSDPVDNSYADSLQWLGELEAFMGDFNRIKNTMPSISYSWNNEFNGTEAKYYFSEGELWWIHVSKSGEEGYREDLFVSNDAENIRILNYSTEMDGGFNIKGLEISTSCTIRPNGDYVPVVYTESHPLDLPYIEEYRKHLDVVMNNTPNFKLKDGHYEYVVMNDKYDGDYGPAEENKIYKIDKALFESEMFSAQTGKVEIGEGIDEIISAYTNWYVPLRDIKGTLSKRKKCDQFEFLKIEKEGDNYLWRIERWGKLIEEYKITKFKESEGDAIYVTIAKDGASTDKILIYVEHEDTYMVGDDYYTLKPEKYPTKEVPCKK